MAAREELLHQGAKFGWRPSLAPMKSAYRECDGREPDFTNSAFNGAVLPALLKKSFSRGRNPASPRKFLTPVDITKNL